MRTGVTKPDTTTACATNFLTLRHPGRAAPDSYRQILDRMSQRTSLSGDATNSAGTPAAAFRARRDNLRRDLVGADAV
jgi:hypothetical protein